MKVVTYWETLPARSMPPYVALGIASMRRALGTDFLLLTPANLADHIGQDDRGKRWAFDQPPGGLPPQVASIVAKSDYIRMAYVERQGGFWIDADSVVVSSFLPALGLEDGRLQWHSEALFGAARGHPLLRAASRNMLKDRLQRWGNPGRIKSLVDEAPGSVHQIPLKYLDPGYSPAYNAKNWSVVAERALPVHEFLRNPELKVLKLYNTNLSTMADVGSMGLSQFFDSGILLSRIFLHLMPDPSYWLEQAQSVMEETRPGR